MLGKISSLLITETIQPKKLYMDQNLNIKKHIYKLEEHTGLPKQDTKLKKCKERVDKFCIIKILKTQKIYKA